MKMTISKAAMAHYQSRKKQEGKTDLNPSGKKGDPAAVSPKSPDDSGDDEMHECPKCSHKFGSK